MCEEVVNESISWYCESVDVSSFDIDIEKRISENKQIGQYGYDEYESSIDIDGAIESVEIEIKSIVEEEIDKFLKDLPRYLYGGRFVDKDYDINIAGVDDLFNSYLQNDDYDDDDRHHDDGISFISEIDFIFNR